MKVASLLSNNDILIGEFKRGKRQAGKHIYDIYQKAIYFFISELVKDEVTAANITGKIFSELWNLHERFYSMEHMKSFLYLYASNACFDHLQQEDENGEDIASMVIQAELLRELSSALETIPTKDRRTLRMRLEGMQDTEIAQQLGLPWQTVRTSREHALTIVRGKLKRNMLQRNLPFSQYTALKRLLDT